MMACEILQTVHTKSPVAIGPQGTSTFVHIALQFTQALSVHGKGRLPRSSRISPRSPAAAAAFPACQNSEVLRRALPPRSRRRGAAVLLPSSRAVERCGSKGSAPDTSRRDRQRFFFQIARPVVAWYGAGENAYAVRRQRMISLRQKDRHSLRQAFLQAVDERPVQRGHRSDEIEEASLPAGGGERVQYGFVRRIL